MNDVCIKNCHACTLQEGITNKSICATLLIPAMIERVFARISAIEAALNRQPELNQIDINPQDLEIKEVKKPLKTAKNEDTENQS